MLTTNNKLMKKILSLCVALLAATQMFASYVPKFDDNGKCTIALSDLSATDGGNLVELNPVADDSGLAVCDISSLPYVHINAIKLTWGAKTTIVKGLCASKDTTAGIRSISTATGIEVESAYNLAGQKVSANAKCVVIQRMKDGRIVKHFNK